MNKQVKIIGLSINENFGILKATHLKFNEENRLTVIKGEVGSGKTTLQRALKLATQGSNTLQDKSLYGDSIDIVTQLLDGENDIFVGCKSNSSGSLDYFLYSTDVNGKKIKDPVIDGVKATPASYLKSLQTALNWNLDQLTSENPTTQRDILLQLYKSELEKKGVVFDKKSPNYVGGVIDQIEKAKEKRSYFDMKRKEVGGIADDLKKKGVDFKSRMEMVSISELVAKIEAEKAKKNQALENPKSAREKKLLELKNLGLQHINKLRSFNEKIKTENKPIEDFNKTINDWLENKEQKLKELFDTINFLIKDEDLAKEYTGQIFQSMPDLKLKELKKELEFNEKGSCISKPSEFEGEIKETLESYIQTGVDYSIESKKELDSIDTSKYDKIIEELEKEKKAKELTNSDALAVNSYRDWKDANEEVNEINRKFFMLLSGIDTGVEGLHIAPEYEINEKGQRVAKGNDIYLMYDGSYDPVYFSNPDKELRKLSAYSDTQKPMICLLIQKYLLSKKPKVLPYLWIDQVPIDKKTKKLLDKMSEELGLWLFVNWTGDFDKSLLKDGEILIENGEVFEKDESN